MRRDVSPTFFGGLNTTFKRIGASILLFKIEKNGKNVTFIKWLSFPKEIRKHLRFAYHRLLLLQMPAKLSGRLRF